MSKEFFIPLTDNLECEDMELPKDFCTLMRQQYGDEVAEALFKGLSEDPSFTLVDYDPWPAIKGVVSV